MALPCQCVDIWPKKNRPTVIGALSLLFVTVGLILQVVSLWGSEWFYVNHKGTFYKIGTWSTCAREAGRDPWTCGIVLPESIHENAEKWRFGPQILMVVALVCYSGVQLASTAFLLTFLPALSRCKKNAQRFIGGFAVLSATIICLAEITFVGKSRKLVVDNGSKVYFGWSLALSIGSVFFILAAVVVLHLDRLTRKKQRKNEDTHVLRCTPGIEVFI